MSDKAALSETEHARLRNPGAMQPVWVILAIFFGAAAGWMSGGAIPSWSSSGALLFLLALSCVVRAFRSRLERSPAMPRPGWWYVVVLWVIPPLLFLAYSRRSVPLLLGIVCWLLLGLWVAAHRAKNKATGALWCGMALLLWSWLFPPWIEIGRYGRGGIIEDYDPNGPVRFIFVVLPEWTYKVAPVLKLDTKRLSLIDLTIVAVSLGAFFALKTRSGDKN